MLTKKDLRMFTKDIRKLPNKEITRDELIDFVLEKQKHNINYCTQATTQELRIICYINNINIKMQGARENEI